MLCNRCHKPVWVEGLSSPDIPLNKRVKGIVHHIKYLNDINLNDINIALARNNLEGICIDCHNKEHFKTDDNAVRSDIKFDEFGNLIEVKEE